MPTATMLLKDKAERGGLAEVATTTPDATVLEAAKRMNEHRIGALLVVDDRGELVGMFTERDVLVRVVSEEKPPGATLVKDVMTGEVIACPPDTRADELRRIMRARRVRHIPIVEGRRIVGMVSIGDLNHAEAKEMHETISYFEQYIYRP